MSFDFEQREIEPDDFEGHKDLRDSIRKASAKAGTPYLKVEVLNEHVTKNTALQMTSITFEILMNTLLNAYVCTQDDMALNLLQTVHNVIDVHAGLASAYSQYLMSQTMDSLSPEQQQELMRKVKNPSVSDVQIPDVILKAFNEINKNKPPKGD